ncbi:CCA tRNA nucleotidyltransferase [Shimia biformata]|uniref:CCA tRNA nucleotidyltransferase n=1 Tax=Shimia biformata TaxID=1294299 RepID=UPI00194DAF1C|nr:CCA tRNA nucleotidyltransferase [Shimia biformata]
MTKITGDWITRPATQAVCVMLEGAGYQALFVGGCVRNALLGTEVNDIDIATDAHPDQVVALAEKAGLHAIPTGIDHGTVTVVSDHVPHEITTFRKDVETDGRRAVVAFSPRVEDDAHRRDFTMNALYACSDGTVLDPLGGLADLDARRVRFIDDATERLQEDYLRALRFFRFHAWYGDEKAGMDADALAAIAANLDGLETLSRERVGAETLKLLAAPDPAPAVGAMRATGALARLLPGADDRALAPLVHLEGQVGVAPDALRRLAALGGDDLPKRLRLSRQDGKRLTLLREQIGTPAGAAELGYRFGKDTGCDVLLLRSAVLEMTLPDMMQADLTKGAAARFPISATDLMPDVQGPALGAALTKLENLWIASGFTLDKHTLLALK